MTAIPVDEVFGRARVVCAVDGPGPTRVWIRCSCGQGMKVVKLDNLKSGRTRSCGCLQREHATRLGRDYGRKNATHGEGSNRRANGRTSEYAAWNAMKSRCHNMKGYADRGITVCREWAESFEAFLRDVGRRPTPQHSLDRKDNDGNYEPDNCRWATHSEQMNNRRRPNRAKT